jgi:HlyD family secretion protein
MKKLLITAFVVILIAGAAVGAYYYKYGKPPEPEIATLQVTRGDVIMQVGATGTIEAVTTVDVGTQVNGVIQEILVDFNKIVKKGDVIAKIDPKTIEATIESDKANLESAQANLERQRITLEDSINKLRRAEDLSKRNLLTQQDLETAQVNVKMNQASIKAQDASIKQTQAKLNQDMVNLGYTIIYAPIDGIVINRKVDVGQTVVSNNAAVSMFQIAADLTQMQVKAGVDESDVGNLRPGQRVTFRVDAFLNKEFVGEVAQVRLQPVVTQNVVTYTTIINVRNPNLELKPGMTATVKIEIAKKENVLRIPNAALRFRPTREIFEAMNLEIPPELQQRGRGQGGMRGGQNAANGQPVQGATSPGGAFQRGGGDRPAQPANQQATLPRGGQVQQGASSQPRGAGQGAQQGQLGGGRGGQGGGQQMTPEERQKRMQERMATMTPEERARFEERMKQFAQGGGRGQGGQGAQGAQAGQGVGNRGGQGAGRNRPAANEIGPSSGVADRGATTIDALFGQLQFIELPGRVWIYTVNGTTKSLKSYNIRTGISDGTVTELVEGAGIDENTKLVTSIDLGLNNQQVRPASSPLMPGGRPGGGPGGGGGRGGR